MSSNWKNWSKNKRSIYHPNFDRRALARKKLVKYTCELCWARQGEDGINAEGNLYKVIVAAAHVNHDPWNPRAKLIILCSPCHSRYDAQEHGKNAHRTLYRKRRETQIAAGQLTLFADRRAK